MKIFDSHCHLDDKLYDHDLHRVMDRAENAGIAALMIVGINRKTSEKAVSMAEATPWFYASVGVHPHDAKHCGQATIDFLRNLAKRKKVHAWGEIGLDFNRMYSARKDQEKCFISQLQAGSELNLPLIFHERDSKGRFIEILRSHLEQPAKGVVHCFSGTREEMEQYLDFGLHIGITGILTVKGRGKKLRSLVPLIPENRLVIETDAPYLTPVPERNKHRRNEPAFVKSVLFKLAQVRKQDPEYLAKTLWDNTCRLFNIK
jgi:TatD DNase family protein